MRHAVIDIGNSSYKLGFFGNKKNTPETHGVFDSAIALYDALQGRPFNRLLLSSVNSERQQTLEKMLRSALFFAHVRYDVLSDKTKIPLRLHYAPAQLGTDRIASAVGSQVLFPKKNCLIIDFGTCITYNFVDARGHYFGGGISPGVPLRLKAFSSFTDGLPSMNISPVFSANQSISLHTTCTEESMQAGILLGITAEIEQMIQRYRAQHNEVFIIFCGGDALAFSKRVNVQVCHEPALSLIGLHRILLNL